MCNIINKGNIESSPVGMADTHTMGVINVCTAVGSAQAVVLYEPLGQWPSGSLSVPPTSLGLGPQASAYLSDSMEDGRRPPRPSPKTSAAISGRDHHRTTSQQAIKETNAIAAIRELQVQRLYPLPERSL